MQVSDCKRIITLLILGELMHFIEDIFIRFVLNIFTPFHGLIKDIYIFIMISRRGR